MNNGILKIKNIILMAVLACFFVSCSSSSDSAQDADSLNGANGFGESDLTLNQEGRYAGGNIPMAEDEGLFKDINFDYDSSSINQIGRQNLEHNLQVLQANPQIRVQLEGHCDSRGTAEYNLALGSRRAQAVYDLLVSYGMPASRLETISYGEEVPLDPNENEAAWAKNRRVHFSAFANR